MKIAVAVQDGTEISVVRSVLQRMQIAADVVPVEFDSNSAPDVDQMHRQVGDANIWVAVNYEYVEGGKNTVKKAVANAHTSNGMECSMASEGHPTDAAFPVKEKELVLEKLLHNILRNRAVFLGQQGGWRGF